VKVVLFCGGLGLRMREASALLPKPMIPLGPRPILWHIMKYYSSFGCSDFVLCLGYRGEMIKEYFLGYNEALSNDFVLRDGGKSIELLSTDAHDWSITFVDTGLNTSIGERLLRVRPYVEDDDVFLATYGDGLTDAPLRDTIDTLVSSDKAALFLCVRPTPQFHLVTLGSGGKVERIRAARDADLWINGGYFVFRPEVFDYLRPGEDLVDHGLPRMIANDKVMAYPYEGFWAPMDTLKDKQTLEALLDAGDPPWSRPRGLGHDAAITPI
jgi:glucose-1-phosphate cytidylyltransferase